MAESLSADDYNASLPPRPSTHPEFGEPLQTFQYFDACGRLLGINAVFDVHGARQEAQLAMNCESWLWQSLPTPTPLYGLASLSERPSDSVVLCDSEANAMAAGDLLPGHVPVSWLGWRSGAKLADWSVLAGREVLLWPSAGEVAARAADAAGKAARAAGAKVKRANPPEDAPEGWGPTEAIEQWHGDELQAWLLERKVGEPHVFRPKKHARSSHAVIDAEGYTTEAPELVVPTDTETWPFTPMGHFEGHYYYVPREGGTVIKLGGAGHSKQALLMLAPLHWWKVQFGCGDRDSWDSAASALIRMSHKFGIYDPWKFRGRGAWLDAGRVVIHLGDRLLVDGVEMKPDAIQSDFFYGRGRTLKFAQGEPLGAKASGQLIDLCKMLSWENTLSAYLLAGAIALAPICGALEWRPHVWIIAAAGGGKTWLAENIISKCVGQMMVNCAAKTTEPGVRRRLSSDAFPVMLDEFEANDQAEHIRCKAMMSLARSASRETSAEILQGSQGGDHDAQSFRIRSMFFFLSIGLSAKDYADLTRISILGLKANRATPDAIAKFNALQDMEKAVITESWVNGLHARMVGLIPTIRHNAEVFALAAAKAMGTRRLGDQAGALLAGAFALTSSKKITPEAASAWIDSQDWHEEQEILLDVDGVNCLARILEYKVPVDSRRGTMRRALGELAELAKKIMEWDEDIPRAVAVATLKRYGLAVMDGGYLGVSNTHSAIAEILKGTPWAVNWNRRLKLITGAMPAPETIYFSGGKTRAILVPLST